MFFLCISPVCNDMCHKWKKVQIVCIQKISWKTIITHPNLLQFSNMKEIFHVNNHSDSQLVTKWHRLSKFNKIMSDQMFPEKEMIQDFNKVALAQCIGPLVMMDITYAWTQYYVCFTAAYRITLIAMVYNHPAPSTCPALTALEFTDVG